jgi:trehalose transport system permease protein
MRAGRWVRAHALEVALAAPLGLHVVLLTVVPLGETVRLSLTSMSAPGLTLDQYARLATSDAFRRAVGNTVVVATLSIALELGLGLLLALTLHARFPLRGVARTLLLLPLAVPTIVSGAVMLLVFTRSGYLNSLIGALADGLGAMGVGWHPEPLAWTVAGGWRTLLTVAVADAWKVLPIVTLILLAGLQAIPDEVYEAARVDGSTTWGRFVHVTLPMLRPYVTVAVVLRAIDAFRIFELALVLAGRVEPVLGTFIWSRYAPPTSDPPAAAAAAMVLFVLVLGFVLVYLRVAGHPEEERA